ncbi:MAG: hypothetical protein IPM24_12970 [Bryobacterales bacterium]|nr:hypothetical protein [Bryobacterales bacterium]
MRRLSYLLLLFVPLIHADAADFALRFDMLRPSLERLTGDDRPSVDAAIEMIRQGEHQAALVRLAAARERNPKNSSLGILSAYALLQLGNLAGAFDQARAAEKAPDHNVYTCWFLAKVALLKGDRSTCQRELGHVRSSKQLAAEAGELQAELDRKR